MTLLDVCELIVDCPHSTAPDEGQGYPLIRTPNIGKGRLILEGVHRVSKEIYDKRNERAVPKKNDLILAREAPVGNVAIIKGDQEVCLGQRTVLIRPNIDIVDPDFLVYYLLSPEVQHVLINSANGATVSHLNMSAIRKLAVNLPKIEEQRKIGRILSSLADKIEINKQINRNLLEQSKTLYKSWFMDFDNTDGVMPQDWHEGTVEEIIELHDSIRKPLSGNEREKLDKIYPYYGATSIMDYVDDYLFDGIYLLLGEDGSVIDADGYPILQYVFGKFWANNHAHIITGKNGFSVEELYLLFSLTHVNDIVTGAVQLKISQQNLKKVEAVIPSKNALRDFDEIIQPMFGQIRKIRLENEKLTSLRDSLLPKLMSGELEVSDIDI